MEILDNYLFDEKVQALNELHIEYAKVHWIGYEYNSKKNPLIDLVLSTKLLNIFFFLSSNERYSSLNVFKHFT